MKTFLLIMTILLLINRISSTPRNFSKKLHEKYIKNEIKSMTDIFSKKNETEMESLKFITQIFCIIAYTFFGLYYLHIGNSFSNKTLYFMSVLQVVTVLLNFRKEFIYELFSTDPEDYKFNRFYKLFNVILDYIYYPMVIYMLLQ